MLRNLHTLLPAGKGSCPSRHAPTFCFADFSVCSGSVCTLKQPTAKEVAHTQRLKRVKSLWLAKPYSRTFRLEVQLSWDCFTFLFLENPGNSRLGFCRSLEQALIFAVPVEVPARLSSSPGPGGSLQAEL